MMGKNHTVCRANRYHLGWLQGESRIKVMGTGARLSFLHPKNSDKSCATNIVRGSLDVGGRISR